MLESGEPSAAPDLDVIRGLFGATVFLGAARCDEMGRLMVAATTAERPYDPARPDAGLGIAWSVFRIRRGDVQPTVLFTNSPVLGDEHTVRYDKNIGFFPLRSWDVSAAGRLIYADPNGGYRVLIGHPADGRVESRGLTPAPGDEEAVAKRAKAEGRSPERYPRIADVQWITEDCFLIKPVAAATGDTLWQTGVVELFDLKGSSLGRRTVSCGYDPEQDSLFLRGSVVVVIRGGRSAFLAWTGTRPGTSTARRDDEIVVDAYDLAPQR
jgi:hypothetical protein